MATAAAIAAALIPTGAGAQAGDTTSVNYTYGERTYTRQMEKLTRGLIAVKTDEGVYLGWRLLGDEGSVSSILTAPAFDVYKNGTKIDTVKTSTNYLDKTGKTTDSYSVAIEGSEELCEAVSVRQESWFDIPMQKPEAFKLDEETSYEYSVGDCSTGDLDGDGEYEIVVKWDANAKDNSQSGISGNVIFDAYKQDGTRLWRIDLGRNVRGGAHYSQFLVYDFDMDGKAEMTVQTAPGSKDGKGNYVTDASADANIKATDNTKEYINEGGYNLTSDEFLTVFDGMTGRAVDTIYYPNQRVAAYVWGDTYGNRCDRFTASVANMDGQRPYAVYMRGYYMRQSGGSSERQAACAVSFDGQRLNCKYSFDTFDTDGYSGKSGSVSYNGNTYKGVNGYVKGNEIYVGNGNHNCTVADVDNDGRDEVITGAICYEITDDDRLGVRWCTFMEHGDALHIGDYDPTHDGFEFFTVHEDGGPNTKSGKTVEIGFGMSVIDANDGSIIFHEQASADTGRGVMANIGMGGYYQIWSAKNGLYMANGGDSFTAGSKSGLSQNFRIFWDGDLNDELLDGTGITSWNGWGMDKIFTANGCVQINGTKANPALQADLFGDWREEVAYPLGDSSAVRVYTTTDLTDYKLPTLMHDPVYRSGVAAEQTAYNQPPHIGFYLADDIFRTKLIGIDVSAPDKTEYSVGEQLDQTGMIVTGSYDDGSNYELTGYTLSGYDPQSAGEQTITVEYRGFSKSFTVNVNTDFTCDSKGMITGYVGSDTTAVIPDRINGVEITGIAENALDGTSIRQLYVYDNIETIEKNGFENITIYCYEGSDAHLYAVENNVPYVLLERASYDYLMNVSFDEDQYIGLSMYQVGQSQSAQIGNVNYTVGGRRQGGDGTTGFGVSAADENSYLRASVGQFATNGRNAFMTFAESPVISADYDSVLSFDLMIPYMESKHEAGQEISAYARIQDADGTIDWISKNELGIEYDTWYGYSLIYHKGSYYRALSDADGALISLTDLGGTTSDTGISKIEFIQEAGSFRMGSNTYIAFDNMKMYTTTTALSDVYVNVKDENGNAVSDAAVTVGTLTRETDEDGVAEFMLPAGIYTASVKAEDYEEKTAAVAAYKSEVTKKISLSRVFIPVEEVKLPESASAAIGEKLNLNMVKTPENATVREAKWTSDNESVISADEDGQLTAKSAGKALITVDCDGVSASCEVTVYDTSSYTQVPTTVEIYGAPNLEYIPLNGVNTDTKLTASVYDQNGVPIKNASVSWSCEGAQVMGGTLIVTPDAKEGTAVITASCGDASAEKEIELVSIISGAEVIVNTTFDEAKELKVVQGTTETEVTCGDLTYGGGERGSGGSASIGVWGNTESNGNVYITGGSSGWSSSGRNSYIIFDKTHSLYDRSKQYLFEADIYFGANASPITLSNGVVISPASTGMESQKWFRYVLVHADNKLTQYIFDDKNELVSMNDVTATDNTPIYRLDFGTGGEEGTVRIDNMHYYAMESVMSRLSVKVFNTENEPLSGADVSIGALGKTTNIQGRTAFDLPIGCYDIAVSKDGMPTVRESAVLDGDSQSVSVTYAPHINTMPYIITGEVTGGVLKMSLLENEDRGVEGEKRFYAAFRQGGRLIGLTSVKTTSKTGTKNRTIMVPEGTDSIICYAWTGDNEPVAEATEVSLN